MALTALTWCSKPPSIFTRAESSLKNSQGLLSPYWAPNYLPTIGLKRTGEGVGHDFLNARYESPNTGKFISQDPLNIYLASSELLTDPQNLNYYAYANDNPITGKDPTGKYVEEITRPIDSYPVLGDFNHSFIYVVPSAGENLPSISNQGVDYDTSQPFTLGGYPQGFYPQLTPEVDEADDYKIAQSQEDTPGVARKIIAPPHGMTSAQFDSSVVNSFNSLGSSQGPYNLLGIKTVIPGANSNNAATSILMNSGVSQSQMNNNVNTLRTASGNQAPGLGMSLSTQTNYSVINILQALVSAYTALLSIYTHASNSR